MQTRRLLPAFVVGFLTVPSVAPARTVTRGPYLQTLTPTSVVVRWRTDIATDSRVAFGPAPGNLTGEVTSGVSTTEHELCLVNLSPGTTYFYAIGTTSIVLLGADSDYFFVTAPSPGTRKRVRVWGIGDSGTADANAAAVRDAYLAWGGGTYTDLWLMLGDNAYSNGTDSQYQAAVFDMYPTLLRQSVLWPTLGNHDGQSASSATQTGPYFDIFTLPKQGEAGGLPSGTEAYYSYDFANIHFVVLDSHDSDRSPGGAMMTWLQSDLAANVLEWVIAYWHHPPYSKGSHDSDKEGNLIDMRENALPILESHGVDLVLSGHSHSYERSFLLNGHYGPSNTLTSAMILDGGDGRENGDGAYTKAGGEGAVYTVAGTSGHTSNGTLNHPAMFLSLQQLGSVVLEVDGGRLDAIYINETGLVEDYLTIIKGPPENQAPFVAAGEDITVILPASRSLDGTVSDDGLPNPPATVTTTWSVVSGPGTVTFADGSAVDTTASFSTDGSYVLRLTADDGELTAFDQVTITVEPAPVNQAPVVDAGVDQTIELPTASVALDGTVTDDGVSLPLTLTWSQVGGSGVLFGDPSVEDTTASFPGTGSYLLELAANDGEFVTSDFVTVTVITGVPPVADLALSKDDGVDFVTSGDILTYTLVATNAGPSDVSEAIVTDVFPAVLTGCSWTCYATGGAICSGGPVSGDLADTIDLPVGGSATFAASCTFRGEGADFVTNGASISAPSGVSDPNPTNDAPSDTDFVLGPCGFPNHLVLAEGMLDDVETISACETLTVGPNVQIVAPAEVTLRAGTAVVLDEGLSVEHGATLSFEIDPSLSGDGEPSAPGEWQPARDRF
ncbi:MAG TPA: metallophosphoesterase [Vicinamibacteria bacterium]|nr:metallophosphoesterase [Vicinamibacteria bacterium]